MVLETTVEKVIVGRLKEGADLLKSLKDVVKEHGIKGGAIKLIGALKKVRLGFFDRSTGKYVAEEAEGFFELVSCIGNISWKGDEPVVHIHMAASSPDGKLMMGHVLEGCIVDVTVEYIIFVFKEGMTRSFDENSKLYLLDL